MGANAEHSGVVHDEAERRRTERVLLAHLSIADCAVVDRTTRDGRQERLAYVVPSSAIVPEELAAWIESAALPRPAQFVEISSLPTADGSLDVAALLALPIADADLARRIEARAAETASVTRAAAMIEPVIRRVPPLHLSDVLPDWSNRGSRTAGKQPAARSSATSTIPAFVDGGELMVQTESPITLGGALVRAAKTSAHGLVYRAADGSERTQSYAELLEGAERILCGLRRSGVTPGDCVVLQLERHQDFLETFWACVLGGFLPVPLAVPPNYEKVSAPLQTLQSAWTVLRAPRLVTVRDAVAPLLRAAERIGLSRARVEALEDLRRNDPADHHVAEADDVALLMLTSGSTGTPKAVCLTHRNILSRTAGSLQLNGFSDRDVSVNWMPLDHVAGLIYFHIRDVFLGCRQVHVPTSRVLQNPLEWLDCLECHRATVTFAPNFAFGLINDRERELGDRLRDLSCVRKVLNGAEAIVASTARRFLTLLAPHGLAGNSMHPAWGMSETSSGVIYGDTFSLATTGDDDPFVEVGRPIPGLSMRIVDETDRIVGEGVVGRLQVTGACVTRGYFGHRDSQDSFTADGWFITGDLGTIRNGRLTITGREKDVVIINSINYYCHSIEAAVEAVEGIATSFTAACAVRPAGANTDRLAIFFHPTGVRDVAEVLAEVRVQLLSKIGIAADYMVPVAADAIPKSSLGKIQRSELGQRFLAGEFDAILKQVDLATANSNTIPNWFYRKTWRRRDARIDREPLDGGTALIFVAGDAVGAQVVSQLAAHGLRCVTVEASNAFEVRGSDSYRIDSGCPEHYDRLFASIAERDCWPTHVVHLWQYGAYQGEAHGDAIESAQCLGVLSVLRVAQSLAARAAPPPTTLTCVSSFAEHVHENDVVAYEKSPAIGLLKSLPQELPWLRCRHVDLWTDDCVGAAAAIVDEICSAVDDREVAYRSGERFKAGLEPVRFDPVERQDPLLRQGGTYLITGGAGGIGERLAGLLIDRFAANVLLVGRSVLEADRLKQLASMARDSGRIAYEPVDVCDESGLRRAVERYRSQWGPFDGAFHLAGSYYESFAAEDTPQRLLAILRPKTIGTDVLHCVLASQGGGFVIASSSLAGFFGGAGIAAYAAANVFQDAYAAHHRRRGAVAHFCFGWSNWSDTGQSRGYPLKDAPRARGYQTMAVGQALQSMLIGLAYRQTRLIVGIDGGHRHIRRSLFEQPDALEQISIYFTAADPHADGHVHAIDVEDRFGNRARPDVIRLVEMALTCSGDVDRSRLVRRGPARDSNRPTIAPRTDAERRLLEIWKRILGVPVVSCDDNFFELGGDSLLAARLAAQIRLAFGHDVPLRTIFDADSLSALAAAIATGSTDPAEVAAEKPQLLTPGQRALWLLHQVAPASCAYNIAFTARIVSPFDVGALERAFQGLVDRHEALRCVFPAVGGEPMRRVEKAAKVRFDVEDASAWSAEQLHERVSQEVKAPFNLAAGPLMRVRLFTNAGSGAVVAVTFHHIVMDGWSLWVCLSELGELYRAARRREASRLAAPIGADRFARRQAEVTDGAEGAGHLEYWKNQLGSNIPTLNLPTDHQRPPLPRYRGASHTFRLGRDATLRLTALAREGRSTPAMAMLALFQLLLQRYSGQDDFVVGYLASGRSQPEFETVVGYLANPLPLRLRVPAGVTFRALLTQTRNTLLDALDHQEYPFLRIVEQMNVPRDASRAPLFQALFVYEKPQLLDDENAAAFIAGRPGARMRLDALDLESLALPMQQEGQFDVTLMVVEADGQLHLTIDYDADLFEASTIQRMGEHLRVLGEAASSRPDAAVSALSLLSDQEKSDLRMWNSTTTAIYEDRVQQMVENAAARHPDATAVVSGAARLTYRELNARANQLAHRLRQLGVRAETPVGLLVDRSSFDLPVGMLAILKAGGAFVPLDQQQPTERLRFMFADSGATVLVAHAALLDRIPRSNGALLVLDREREPIADCSAENPDPAWSGNLAYIIYTSGSTGQPKGVLVEHGGLRNLACEQQRLFKPAPGSRVLQFASMSFDACVFDFVMALCSGAALHLATREAILPGLPLLDTLKREAITIVTLPPSALANVPHDPLPNLNVLCVAGEACPPDLVARWAPGRRFFNLYGPTEATIWATYAECSEDGGLPPIGRPIANTQTYVLDAAHQQQPVGVAGELYLAGIGLARGYLHQPALTARGFLDATPIAPRLYRTGDIVRRQADGQLLYIGRVDEQVKLRGFRIEPGEIEAALSRHAGVGKSLVMVREDVPGDRRLVAYVVARQSPPPSATVLKRFLQQQLPDYMVPSAFVTIDDFPVNASGKTDRTALPAPAVESDAMHVAASGAFERLIHGVWADVLQTDSIGVDDNFFDIGGNSLLLARVHARLNDALPSALSIVDMFQFPTIRALAAQLTSAPAGQTIATAARPQGPIAGQARLRDLARRRTIATDRLADRTQ